MNARTLFAGLVSSSLLVTGCPRPAAAPDVVAPVADPASPRRPPPGVRIDTWPDLGTWPVTARELPGSNDLFLWEAATAPAPPKAQVPLRLHRPVE